MPRYVILRHEMPLESERSLHWDLMLQQNEALLTWALDEPPCSPACINAIRLDDHRPVYLEYEGEISGNRGTVSRWDAGLYQMLENHPHRMVIRLSGRRLECEVAAEPVAAGPHWQFSFGTVDGNLPTG